jgi:hypothetical protein
MLLFIMLSHILPFRLRHGLGRPSPMDHNACSSACSSLSCPSCRPYLEESLFSGCDEFHNYKVKQEGGKRRHVARLEFTYVLGNYG